MRKVFDRVEYSSGQYEAAASAAALAIVTEWDACRALDFAKLKTTLAQPI